MRRLELSSITLLSVIAAGCGRVPAPEPDPVPVLVQVVEAGSITGTVTVPCRLEGSDEAVLAVSTPATVTSVLVSEGDAVEEGDILLTMETDGLHSAGISTAAARVSAARAAQEYAAGSLARAEDLYESGALSESGIETARASEASSQATLGLARAGYQQAVSEASVGQVRAPFAGTITRVWVRTGNPASGNLVALAGGEVLEASLGFAPCRLRQLSEGQPVFLETTVFPGELFDGVITAVSPSIDPVSGLAFCTAQFGNADGRLRSGMSGTATVALTTVTGAVVVPQSAMERQPGGGWRVAVSEGGICRFRTVEAGMQDGFDWQILSGLSVGDTLVVFGINRAYEGCRLVEAGI